MSIKNFHGIPLVALPPTASRILFVSNLDKSITSQILYRVFHKFGTLTQVRLGNTPETANKAFVCYDNIFSAQQAVEHLHGVAAKKNGKGFSVVFWDPKKHAVEIERKKKRQDRQAQLGRRQRELAADVPTTSASAASNNNKDDVPTPPNEAS